MEEEIENSIHHWVTEYTDWVTPGSTTTDINPYTNYLRRHHIHQHSLFTCLRIRGLAVRLVRAHYEHQGLTFVFSVFSFVLFEQFFLCLLELGELSGLHLDRHFR